MSKKEKSKKENTKKASANNLKVDDYKKKMDEKFKVKTVREKK